MDIETAIESIVEWYGDEEFSIAGITEKPHIDDRCQFDQHVHFISVVGHQYAVGDSGDSFAGSVYFEYKTGKYIQTDFWC